jgi:DNA processing protein
VRTDCADWIRLCLVPGVSGAAQRALLRHFGSPLAVAGADIASVAEIAGPIAAEALAAGPDAALLSATLAWLDEPRHHLLALGDSTYPRALLQIPDPPTMLLAKGDVGLLNRPAFAIVGSRNATHQGLIDAQAFARSLSDAGYAIASGLALGIDAAAHRGGLAGKSRSIAVVGTGLDRVYPAANRELAHTLADRGVLLSELPLGTPPSAANFPRRNRIISGLSQGVLVVEAAQRSGSLTTARLALEQGRDVFAIPGSIHSPLSKGCHWLIKQGAKLVESAEDVLAELGAPRASLPPEDEPVVAVCSSDDLLAAIGHSPVSVDALALRTGRAAPELAAELTVLELEGRVERLPGGQFRRLSLAT